MIYRIEGFDEGPHWDIALIEADREQSARDLLALHLDAGEGGDTVWAPLEQGDWRVSAENGPLLFVLGGGCR